MTVVVGSSCMARLTEEQGGCRDFFQLLCRFAPLRNSEGRELGTDPTGSSEGATLSQGRSAAHLGGFWSTIRGSHERPVADRRRLHEPSLAAAGSTAPETGGPLVGTCPAMRQVYKEIGLVAAQDFPVIITGETGTGKELVARAIHEHSNRARRPFL